MKAVLPLAASLLAVASFAGASAVLADAPTASPSPAAKTAAKKATAKTGVVYCAVTGDKIGDASKSVGTSVYKGKTYYFCCAGCKPQFDKNPAKFAKAADERAAKAAKEGVAKTASAPKKS